ncbi:MAG: S41 family peptidase [Planctomycetota bacterium]
MKTLSTLVGAGLLAALSLGSAVQAQDTSILLPLDPHLSPVGDRVVFAHLGDLWIRDLNGPAVARRLTSHPARDGRPIFSPDGEQVLFLSDRDGTLQAYVVAADGGLPRQVTVDSESKTPLQWTPDGEGFLAVRTSDASPFATEARRIVRIPLDGSSAERNLVDCGANTGALSADGNHLLFLRGRIQEERKAYRGPAAEQIWHADLTTTPPTLTRHSKDLPEFQNISERHPLWNPDGSGYWFVSDPDGTFDLHYRDLASGKVTRLTNLRSLDGRDDGVWSPSLSADGSKILFRRGVHLHLCDTSDGALTTIGLERGEELPTSWEERRRLDSASAAAFTDDGKQCAFVSGHDLYVMDRILREPKRVTTSMAIEGSPVFSQDGSRLFFTSEVSGEVDIWEATCDQEDGIWWLCDEFSLRKVTDDVGVESSLAPSPTGEHFAYLKGTDLWVMDQDGSDHRRFFQSWDAASFDWSPDGRWLCWSVQDEEFNDDVWIASIDGTTEPFNLSMHPDDDRGPVWAPDGSRIAWTGRRQGDESDIYVITLNAKTEEQTERDRKLEEALAAMQKGKKPKKAPEQKPEGEDEASEDEDLVEIDLDGIHERLQRISIPDSFEGGLLWSADGKELFFSASVDGQRGIFKVAFPDELTPKRVASSAPANARWLKDGNQVVGLSGGKPASMNPKSGKIETFAFSVRENRDWHELRGLAFDQGWRAMRDRFYDPAMNNRDWDAVRAHYRPIAMQLLDQRAFSLWMNMMLGELNASHMGHRGGSDPLPSFDRPQWSNQTAQLGLRFSVAADGPGLLVESVIPGSPCSLRRSLVEAGERVVAIDGQPIDRSTNLQRRMTVSELSEMTLSVLSNGETRDVVVRPTSSVRGLLYDEWVENTRAEVERLSNGRLGYLHIRGMNQSSFYQLEEDLYAAAHGKDGLIVDVRFNGGGSTADRVLTVLTQPKHAITVPRNGPIGYPQDRKVYASWTRPIVLMCNEMSFSNAEILSHAVKTLNRGPVVGMRTAGGVISTGGQGLLDGSFVRMPFRGWYVSADGRDMELNGCLPNHALWNDPVSGDAQLEKAVEVLAEQVSAAPADPAPSNASAQRGR